MNEQVTQYIKSFDPAVADRLQRLREFILKFAPQVTETISYAIPAYKIDGKVFIYFAGYPHHVGMYPGNLERYDFSESVKKYASGKSTLKFSNDKPLPFDVIEELLRYRLEQIK